MILPAATRDLLPNLAPLTPRLEILPVEDQRTIFLNGHPAARYRCDDMTDARGLAAQLVEALSLPDRQMGAAFGWRPVTLSRFRGLARSRGASAPTGSSAVYKAGMLSP